MKYIWFKITKDLTDGTFHTFDSMCGVLKGDFDVDSLGLVNINYDVNSVLFEGADYNEEDNTWTQKWVSNFDESIGSQRFEPIANNKKQICEEICCAMGNDGRSYFGGFGFYIMGVFDENSVNEYGLMVNEFNEWI